jgi:phosphatidylglycerophosphatase A
MVALCIVFTLLGAWSAGYLERFWGQDPSRVVMDETVGVWIPLIVVGPGQWWWALAALVLFRFFDIVKPLGVRRMEALPGGWGVMADDVLAGVYSLLILFLAQWLI